MWFKPNHNDFVTFYFFYISNKQKNDITYYLFTVSI